MDDERKYGTSRASQIIIEDPNSCFVCNAPFDANDTVCPTCGFPQNGDEWSQRQYLGQLRGKKIEVEKTAFRVAKAFHFLVFVPTALFLMAISYWQKNNLLYAEVCLALSLTFASIWHFGTSKPYLAFLLSLILYALITIPIIILNPSSILSTHFFILTPYLYLPIGMYNFRKWEYLDKETSDRNSG